MLVALLDWAEATHRSKRFIRGRAVWAKAEELDPKQASSSADILDALKAAGWDYLASGDVFFFNQDEKD